MLHLFRKYKTVVRFIVVFLGSYLVLSMFYKAYLVFFISNIYYPDYITHLVSHQAEEVIQLFSYKAKIAPNPNELSMKLYVNNKYLARIVEGCNSVSIIILFVSFMLSFFKKPKPTLLYILMGVLVIYAMNVLRIAVLAIGLYKYPQYSLFLHSILFPLLIYGTVFLLWLFWIRRYVKWNSNE